MKDIITVITNFIQNIPANKKTLAFHYILSILFFATHVTNLTIVQIAQKSFSFLGLDSISSFCEKINYLFYRESVLDIIARITVITFAFIITYRLFKELLPGIFLRKSDSSIATVILIILLTILPHDTYPLIFNKIFSFTGSAIALIIWVLAYIGYTIFMSTKHAKKYIAKKYKDMKWYKYYLYTLVNIPILAIIIAFGGYYYTFIHTTSQILFKPLHMSLIEIDD